MSWMPRGFAGIFSEMAARGYREAAARCVIFTMSTLPVGRGTPMVDRQTWNA